jgi:hypothetical protein
MTCISELTMEFGGENWGLDLQATTCRRILVTESVESRRASRGCFQACVGWPVTLLVSVGARGLGCEMTFSLRCRYYSRRGFFPWAFFYACLFVYFGAQLGRPGATDVSIEQDQLCGILLCKSLCNRWAVHLSIVDTLNQIHLAQLCAVLVCLRDRLLTTVL